jgi:hypothetical protein
MSPENVRLTLLANGYCPLPINGKRPMIGGWQKLTDATADQIRLWATTRSAETNTGILTARTPALDLDIRDPDAADAAERLVKEFFEEKGHVPVRFGNRPKRALFFRTDAPFAKITVNFDVAEGAPNERIEFLCDGQQIVVHGVHPETRVAYSWSGGSPSNVKREELPYIHAEEAQELVGNVVKLLTEQYGYRLQQPKAKKAANGADSPDIDGCDWRLTPNVLMDHDEITARAMRFVKSGMNPGAVKNLLRDNVAALEGVDEGRRQRRLDEIRDMIDSAVRKIKAKRQPEPEPEKAPGLAVWDAGDVVSPFEPREWLLGVAF